MILRLSSRNPLPHLLLHNLLIHNPQPNRLIHRDIPIIPTITLTIHHQKVQRKHHLHLQLLSLLQDGKSLIRVLANIRMLDLKLDARDLGHEVCYLLLGHSGGVHVNGLVAGFFGVLERLCDGLADIFRAGGADKLVAAVSKLVNRQLVATLGLQSDIEESKTLGSYGIDSLAAADLRNWFKIKLRVELTILDILNASSLQALCVKVIEHLIKH